MVETAIAIGIFLGVPFILCKLVNKVVRACRPDEIINLMTESLSMRTGDLSHKQRLDR